MARFEFKCPNCNREDNLVLMGDEKGKFDKECNNCKTKLEIIKDTETLEVKAINEKGLKNIESKIQIPSDYKRYEFNESNQKIAKFIAVLILTASIMGIFTGYMIINFFSNEYSEYEVINIEIVVKNNTSNLDNAEIHIDGKKIKAISDGNGTYNVIMKPGKYSFEVKAYSHMDASMDIFIPPQDNNLSLVDVEKGIEGVNRFTFNMKEGEGKINLEESTYMKMETWCSNLIFLFSLIGIWGAWVTYKLQSYNNAQIGAFFSVLAMGFFIIGPILGIMALYYLKKHKNMFTVSFKN